MIIFIGGYWGVPTYACCGGRRQHWEDKTGKWVQKVKEQVGDRHAWYFDGSATKDGKKGGLHALPRTLLESYRHDSGAAHGQRYARRILKALERNEEGEITESIKYITSSMGAAWQRGFSQALMAYAGKHPELSKGLDIEYVLDLDAVVMIGFRDDGIARDPHAGASYYMCSSGQDSPFLERMIGTSVPGAVQLGLDKDGKSLMRAHHPSHAPVRAIPCSKKGSSEDKDVEHATDKE